MFRQDRLEPIYDLVTILTDRLECPLIESEVVWGHKERCALVECLPLVLLRAELVCEALIPARHNVGVVEAMGGELWLQATVLLLVGVENSHVVDSV